MSIDDALERRRAARAAAKLEEDNLAPITCTPATCKLPAFLRDTHAAIKAKAQAEREALASAA